MKMFIVEIQQGENGGKFVENVSWTLSKVRGEAEYVSEVSFTSDVNKALHMPLGAAQSLENEFKDAEALPVEDLDSMEPKPFRATIKGEKIVFTSEEESC